MQKKFSINETIQFGWQTLRKNLGFWISLLIIVGLLFTIPDVIANQVRKESHFFGFIIDVLSFVLSILISIGLIKISLRFCDQEKGKFSDLFLWYPLFFKYLFSSILYGLIVVFGLVLLIVPGIIWAIKFFFYDYFIVDKGVGPIEALKRSSALTKGIKWDLFVFSLVLLIINFLGALAFVIGLFITIPITMVAQAFVYRKLLSQIETTSLSLKEPLNK